MNTLELINKDGYINVNEELYLDDRLNFLLAIWKDIVLSNSSKKFIDLKDKQKDAINELSKEYNIKTPQNITMGSLDKIVVNILLLMATKLNKISVVDFIFKRTKSAALAMPEYFYPVEIINAYIKLLNIDKAISVLEYIEKIEHKSYWYKIINIEKMRYSDYPEFYKKLKQMQYNCYAKLLKSGEILNIELNIDLFKEINRYI